MTEDEFDPLPADMRRKSAVKRDGLEWHWWIKPFGHCALFQVWLPAPDPFRWEPWFHIRRLNGVTVTIRRLQIIVQVLY